MEIAFYLIKQTLLTVLEVLDVALLIRVILSWIMQGEESRFSVFLYTVTEPFILPLRKLFYKMNWFQQTPIDMPFLFTVLLLMVLQTVLRML